VTLCLTFKNQEGDVSQENVLDAAKGLLVPSMISSRFFVRGFVNVYFGAGIHLSDTIFEYDIPVEVNQLHNVIDICRSMLIFKVCDVDMFRSKESLLNHTKLLANHQIFNGMLQGLPNTCC
jgi:hypothetical protein